MFEINKIDSTTILFSPLNWGFGHLSRSISILKKLSDQNNKIFIACHHEFREVYEYYFNDDLNINYIDHPKYPFRFKGKGNFISDNLFNLRLLKTHLKEIKAIKEYVNQYKIDLVLSDHRYGFRHSKIPSIFITHQINLPLKSYQSILQLVHHTLIKKFNQIWVLDNEQNEFAGKLSFNTIGDKVSYIGIQSRFKLYTQKRDKKIDQLIIISGPEPYSTQFYKQMLSIYPEKGNNKYIYHQKFPKNWREIDVLMLTAKKIITRSGYSSIMDLYYLGSEFELHPTPGQVEQEYLADLHKTSI